MVKTRNKISILFVCLGNICRSPAAEEIMRQTLRKYSVEELFNIDSAGLYGGHAGSMPDGRMTAHAARRGYVLKHKARSVTTSDFDNFDIIIAMDDSNYRNLQLLAPTLDDVGKIAKAASFLSYHCNDCVPDPYYGGADGFENVIDLLEDIAEGVYKKLKTEKRF